MENPCRIGVEPAGIGKFLKSGSQEDGSSVLWKGLEMLTSCPMIEMASTFRRSIVEGRREYSVTTPFSKGVLSEGFNLTCVPRLP